jgi:cysteine dioxygenase
MKLPKFFRALDEHDESVPIDTLVELLKRVEIDRADIEHVIAFDPDRYKRNVLKVGPGYAALVLCWAPGQASPIHDHRGSACGVMVLEGKVTETKYERGADGLLTQTTTGTLDVGEVCGSYDADIHIIRNAETDGSNLITLHIYSPPLQDYHIYTMGSTEVEVRSDEETLAAQRALAAQRS